MRRTIATLLAASLTSFTLAQDTATPASKTPAQKATLSKLSPESVTATELAGEPITAKLSHAPGNGAAIGGLKVQTESAWFAARPSGTEDVYKLYAESLKGEEHLREVQEQARAVALDGERARASDAAQLERPARLRALELEVHVATHYLAQRRGLHERGANVEP